MYKSFPFINSLLDSHQLFVSFLRLPLAFQPDHFGFSQKEKDLKLKILSGIAKRTWIKSKKKKKKKKKKY